jgi:hypothetical protein
MNDEIERSETEVNVPGGKGASLFFMIPLERWNVERSGKRFRAIG